MGNFAFKKTMNEQASKRRLVQALKECEYPELAEKINADEENLTDDELAIAIKALGATLIYKKYRKPTI